MIYLFDEQVLMCPLESIKTQPKLANDAAPMHARIEWFWEMG